MRGPTLSWLAVAAASTAISSPALAVPNDVAIGGRTATMGGAGTAAGNDSAMPYLNPAGMASIPADVLAISASLYGYTQRSIPRLFAPNGVHPDYGGYTVMENKSRSETVFELPSSVMYFRHVGKPGDRLHHVLGVSLVIPSMKRMQLSGAYGLQLPDYAGGLSMTTATSNEETEYYIGPSYALGIGDRIRLGVSLYALYTRLFRTTSFTKFLTMQGGAQLQTTKINYTTDMYAWSFAPVAGAQFRLFSDVWAGIGIAAPSVHVFGRAMETAASSDLRPSSQGSGVVAAESSISDRAWYKAQTPLRLNAGLAYDNRKSFSIAADVRLYLPRKKALEAAGTATMHQTQTGETARSYKWPSSFEQDTTQAVSVSVGSEIVLNELLALRGGFFTDTTRTQQLQLSNSELHDVRENSVGGSLGVGLTLGPFDSTLGVLYAYSSGKIVTADTLSDPGNIDAAQAIVSTTAHTALVVISGAVTTEDAKDTIEKTLPVKLPGGR